ncbi:MAG: hypothetical protein JW955_21960 [Sedimentisphaerales bacterium]|nr:hypothetical protein [Sedimentisphaerales bacterium]
MALSNGFTFWGAFDAPFCQSDLLLFNCTRSPQDQYELYTCDLSVALAQG